MRRGNMQKNERETVICGQREEEQRGKSEVTACKSSEERERVRVRLDEEIRYEEPVKGGEKGRRRLEREKANANMAAFLQLLLQHFLSQSLLFELRLSFPVSLRLCLCACAHCASARFRLLWWFCSPDAVCEGRAREWQRNKDEKEASASARQRDNDRTSSLSRTNRARVCTRCTLRV